MDERQLREVFNLCDIGWVLTEDTANRARQFLKEMRDVDRCFEETFERPLLPRLEDTIVADITRFKPLVQTFASPMTTPIRTMVYCVLDGARVAAIKFDYEFKARLDLKVGIEYDSGERATFASHELWDVEVLRHFGLMKLGKAPVIDGYYAFRKGDLA